MPSNRKTLIDGDFEVGSAHLYVDVENNRVGLNQANPASSLDVNGDIAVRGTTFIKANTGTNNLAIGTDAGTTSQGDNAVALGNQAGKTGQGSSATAVGHLAGLTGQGTHATAVGRQAGEGSQGSSATAVGHLAGQTGQGLQATAVGRLAGQTSQGNYTTAVGRQAGMTEQEGQATAVGNQAGESSQSYQAVAVGSSAGQSSQGSYAVAVGSSAGQTSQGTNTVAVGRQAGETGQSSYSVAVGYQAGATSQGNNAIAVGRQAGQTSQGIGTVAIGLHAGATSQGNNTVAVGREAGQTGQGSDSVVVGYLAGQTSQGNFATAVGSSAGKTSQGASSTAVGRRAGETEQGSSATAVGHLAGATSQEQQATAVGNQAGQSAQGHSATAVGLLAGRYNQSSRAVAVGRLAGQTSQGVASTAMGNEAGKTNQGNFGVAVGHVAGETGQGNNAIAVGREAGRTSQADNSIILNATGSVLNSTTASSFHVKPVRGGNFAASALAYTSTGEIVEETGTHFDTSGNVGIGTDSPATYLHLSAKNSNPGATEGDFVGTHDLTEYLRFTSVADSGDVNAVSVGFKLGGDDNSTSAPDGRLDICANDGSSVGNSYGSTPDRTIATFLGSGNVGIGTTSPDTALDVSGTVKSTHVSLGTSLNPTIGGNWVTILNNTYDGDIGDNHPNPEGGLLFANQSSSNRFPWGYYMGVVKDVASTNSNSIRFDIGKSSDLNTNGGTGGTDTLTPYLTIDNGNVGIGTTNPSDKLHIYGSPMIQHDTVYNFDNSQGWYKIGVWDPTGITGARLKISFLGMEGYSSQNIVRGGETILYASCNNNVPATKANIDGRLHAYGDPVITQVKFVHLDGSRHKFEIRAYIKTFVQMSMTVECTQTESFTKDVTASTDPGSDSSTVSHALFTHVVNNNGNVGIGTTNPSSRLTVNEIPVHSASYDHSLAPMTITNRTPTSNSTLNDPKHVLNLAREGTNSESYGARATFKLSRYENNGSNSRTRLDLNLAHGSYDEPHIMTFRSDGNVGIGVTNPLAALHVYGNTYMNVGSRGNVFFEDNVNDNADGAGVTLRTGGNPVSGSIFSVRSSGNASRLWVGQSITTVGSNDFYAGGFSGVNGQESDTSKYGFVVKTDGKVGIGKTDPTTALDVVGDILASGNVTAYSDRRLKSDIERIEGALDKVCALGGYTFTMNDKRSTGLIAQEVRGVLPEAVHGSEETHYSLAYGNMAGLLVEAIKELSSELKTLKQKIG